MLAFLIVMVPGCVALGCWVGSKFELSRSYPLVCALLALAAVNVGMLASTDIVKLVAAYAFAFTFGSAGWCLYPLVVDPSGYERLLQSSRRREALRDQRRQ